MIILFIPSVDRGKKNRRKERRISLWWWSCEKTTTMVGGLYRLGVVRHCHIGVFAGVLLLK